MVFELGILAVLTGSLILILPVLAVFLGPILLRILLVLQVSGSKYFGVQYYSRYCLYFKYFRSHYYSRYCLYILPNYFGMDTDCTSNILGFNTLEYCGTIRIWGSMLRNTVCTWSIYGVCTAHTLSTRRISVFSTANTFNIRSISGFHSDVQ